MPTSSVNHSLPFSRPYNIYIKEINGLRGLCSLLVFFSHYISLFFAKTLSAVETNFNLLALLGDYGRFGVDIFFCISGFFVYWLYAALPTDLWRTYRAESLEFILFTLFFLYIFFSCFGLDLSRMQLALRCMAIMDFHSLHHICTSFSLSLRHLVEIKL